MDDYGITKNPKSKFLIPAYSKRFQEVTQFVEKHYLIALDAYYDIRITVAECTPQCEHSNIFLKIPESNYFEIEKLLDAVFHPLRIIVSGKVA